jgi:hypothetical protein
MWVAKVGCAGGGLGERPKVTEGCEGRTGRLQRQCLHVFGDVEAEFANLVEI